MKVDLRSDTVTKPTKGMLEAMFSATVGDDIFDEDPTVKLLEEKVAGIFGKEAALFCPSGTMTNQIAIRLHTEPQDQVICDKRSHIYHYEGGGVAYNSLVSVCLVDGDRGRINATQIHNNINPDDIHFPKSKLVVLECTVNRGGGSYYILPQVAEIRKAATEHQLLMHLDGARIFNALAESAENPKEWGSYFDTVSVCLSKGLGAPIGSVLTGSQLHISKAKRVRKVLGGAMRQVGYLAAAGIYALDNHIEILAADNHRARQLGEILMKCPVVDTVDPVETNIVIFTLKPEMDPSDFVSKMDNLGIMTLPFGGRKVRMVTHHEITDNMVQYVDDSLKKLFTNAK